MDRFKSPVIQTDNQLLSVMFYHDLNSYRVGMVDHPRDYEYSSYAFYAEGRPDPLLTAPPSYLELGDTAEERQQVYREYVALVLEQEGRKVKRPYSNRLYIGDPNWVAQRTAEAKQLARIKRIAYLDRQRRFYQQLRRGSP